jgi:hypothetical protein
MTSISRERIMAIVRMRKNLLCFTFFLHHLLQKLTKTNNKTEVDGMSMPAEIRQRSVDWSRTNVLLFQSSSLERRAMISDESDLDLLPEYCRYRDDGCEFADSCLNCTFPECIYAQPGGRQQWLKGLRDKEVLRLFSGQGKGAKELGVMFGVSQRTIQRILKRARDE